MPAAKSLNFVNTLGLQKPMWANFLEFYFFYLKRQSYKFYQEKDQVELISFSYLGLT